MLLATLLIAAVLLGVEGHESNEQITERLLNRCVDSVNHKPEPGVEEYLKNQCAPWRNRSCCTHLVQEKLHELQLYNFDFEHCSQKLSPRCKKHFVQDLCFYECSPNVGPWIVSVKMKIRKERFFQVPLCQSDCDSWFEACQDDLTCIRNWIREFDWQSGKNYCPATSAECKKFKHIWEKASDFCEEVWDHSWKVVPDTENCMRLWFDGSQGNPNDHVAKLKVLEMINSAHPTKECLPMAAVLATLLITF